ncbi:c-type cytochrome [Nitratidesulfovibrio vulgaris]|nr:c-type cytochrome [Nitratidesulfovibrio vulgaris]ADP87951.1 cytochrome c class I [Nitratidesulfovibrio vulgaris RCH1]
MRFMRLIIAASLILLAASPGMAADGKALFNAVCARCHGTDGSFKLKGKTAVQVETALEGYRQGTYGGPQKATMQQQAARLSPEDIKALAAHIATFQ